MILRAIEDVRKLSKDCPLPVAYDPHIWVKTVLCLRKMKNVFNVGLVFALNFFKNAEYIKLYVRVFFLKKLRLFRDQ